MVRQLLPSGAVSLWERYPLPHLSPDLPMAFLFARLGIPTVLSIVGALLVQRPVLVHSSDPDLLTPVCEAVLGLLHPLLWEDVYVPVLPTSLVDMIEAPTSYLLGYGHGAGWKRPQRAKGRALCGLGVNKAQGRALRVWH